MTNISCHKGCFCQVKSSDFASLRFCHLSCWLPVTVTWQPTTETASTAFYKAILENLWLVYVITRKMRLECYVFTWSINTCLTNHYCSANNISSCIFLTLYQKVLVYYVFTFLLLLTWSYFFNSWCYQIIKFPISLNHLNIPLLPLPLQTCIRTCIGC